LHKGQKHIKYRPNFIKAYGEQFSVFYPSLAGPAVLPWQYGRGKNFSGRNKVFRRGSGLRSPVLHADEIIRYRQVKMPGNNFGD